MFMMMIQGTFIPNKKPEFLTIWKNTILPTLKKQTGFVEEVLLSDTEDPEVCVGLSFWKTQADAERYHQDVFPKMVGSVEHLMEDKPTVQTFNVEASQAFGIAAGRAA